MVYTVLVVEDEPDIAEAVEFFLGDEGYEVAVAASPEDALAQIDAHSFDFILTDLFRDPDADVHQRDPLASARAVLQRARPTPVGVMTAWPVPESEALARGFACLIRKPFDLNALLACVANGIQTQLSPEEARWTGAVHAFFAALGAGDMVVLERLCAEDVRFVAPQYADTELVIEGRTDYLAFAAARSADVPGVRFVDVRVYGTPHRLAARYEIRWPGVDGAELSESGATVFRFDADGRIRQIGVDYNPKRHRQLTGAWSGRPNAATGRPVIA